MKKRTRSLLEEINSLAPKKDKTALLESKGNNAISSIINILEMIDLNFSQYIDIAVKLAAITPIIACKIMLPVPGSR